jgi:cytidine deaminase
MCSNSQSGLFFNYRQQLFKYIDFIPLQRWIFKSVIMESKNISVSWLEYGNISELDQSDRELLTAAREVSPDAYAPYSGFRVGAALRLENGVIVRGTNVENAAFPSGICAERNVLSTASSNNPGIRPVALAISARTSMGLTTNPVSPCGNCRQVIAEEEFRYGKSIRVILGGSSGVRIIEKGGDLLPLQFSRDDLKFIP